MSGLGWEGVLRFDDEEPGELSNTVLWTEYLCLPPDLGFEVQNLL